tara:strand:+ start:176 stop:1057 length:882 start_codon:yes stop_codon:yes gene_type:complete
MENQFVNNLEDLNLLSNTQSNTQSNTENTKLFIPLICNNQNANAWFMMSILKLTLTLKEKNIEAIYYPIFFESLIPRARNSAIAHFMGSNCTHILFIDSNIVFEPNAILKLLSQDKEIIGATYPKKYMRLDGSYPFDFNITGNIQVIENNSELFKVSNLPAGFSLIKRELIRKLMDTNPQLKYINSYDEYSSDDDKINDSFYNLYNCGISENNDYLNEDEGFCHLVTKCDTDIYLEPSITLRNNGLFGYEGCFKDFLNIKIHEYQKQQQQQQQQQQINNINHEELSKELFPQS